MPQRILLFAPLIALLLSACAFAAPEPPTPTPPDVVELMLTTQPGSGLIPTALPPEVVHTADLDYLLLSNIYARVAPSVVSLEIVTTSSTTQRAAGFIYDDQGHIITGAHVVSAAREVRVTFHDGYIATAEIIGIDSFSDLAVLRVTAAGARLRPVTFGDSNLLLVGQRAIILGNPFGLVNSMTTGIISGVGRRLPSAELIDTTTIRGFQNPSIIQVDASISGGNSGGPLLNSDGVVIGVVTAIQTETGAFEGVGFAVPSNTVQRVAPRLIQTGSVAYAWLGVNSIREENGLTLTGLAEPLNLPVDEGVLVTTITLGSPAAQAGLRGGNRLVSVWGRDVCAGGDIIVAIDGQYLADMTALLTYLLIDTLPGDTIVLTIIRDDQTLNVPVTLGTRPTAGEQAISECE
ncbi:MAG: trypsin-like peptidase domain-containing protein [Chloroflexi bacterium]|nr:trypsin-like peptidase domain-containing protein [Chloroflexota bacterium]